MESFNPNLAINMTDAYNSGSVLRIFFQFGSLKGAHRYMNLANAFCKKTFIQVNLTEEM